MSNTVFDLGRGMRGGISNPPDATLQLPSDAVGRFFSGRLTGDFQLLSRMWLEAKELLDAHPAVKVDAGGIPEFFEEAHSVEMEYRIESGGR